MDLIVWPHHERCQVTSAILVNTAVPELSGRLCKKNDSQMSVLWLIPGTDLPAESVPQTLWPWDTAGWNHGLERRCSIWPDSLQCRPFEFAANCTLASWSARDIPGLPALNEPHQDKSHIASAACSASFGWHSMWARTTQTLRVSGHACILLTQSMGLTY